MRFKFLSIFLTMVYLCLNAQEGHFYIQIPESKDVPVGTTEKSGDQLKFSTSEPELKATLDKYQIREFKKAFPTAVTPFLQEIYEVRCNSNYLMNELHSKFPKKYPLVEDIMEPIPLYEPNDYGTNGGWLHDQKNLDLIRLPEAWELTKGNPNMVIGITDTDFQLDHPDLQGKIVTVRGSNPYTGAYSHGTGTSSIMGAQTDNNEGISGICINCPMLVSSNWASDNEMLLIAQSGVRVINASWINSCSYSSIQEAVYDEIRNVHNCVVTAGAGNNPSHCGSQTAYVYPASYDNVISVTNVGHELPRGSTESEYGWIDCHEYRAGHPENTTHHNDKVDLTAPGWAIAQCFSNSEYNIAWGTSCAAPHVAGTCGLIFSANPCLTANEAVDILYNTADNIDNIPENAPYVGLLGHGRLNAYEAVKAAIEAGRVTNTSSTYSGTQTITAPTILSAAGRVTSGSDITFQAPQEVELRAGFEVELGAEFEIVMDYTCPF